MYLYVAADLQSVASFDEPSLAALTERHHLRLLPPERRPPVDIAAAITDPAVDGVVFELTSGVASPDQLQLIERLLRAARRAWVYWPGEEAVECVDAQRLQSLRRHAARVRWLKRVVVPIDTAVVRWNRVPTALRWIYRGEFPVRRADILVKLTQLTMRAQPLPLAGFRGPAMYLRCDYWHNNGMVDAHMQGVVRSLARVAESAVCLMPGPHGAMDAAGVRAVEMDPPRMMSGEDAIVLAPVHYFPIIKAAAQALRPAFLYERLTAGQSVGAEISQQLGVPYVVEYETAEAIVGEALHGASPFYPELYQQAEELALRQASAILVGTAERRQSLVARGIDASRVLVVVPEGDAGAALESFVQAPECRERGAARSRTGDLYKDQVQDQWNQNPVGSQHARESQPQTLDWFREIERHRYGIYAPWMPEVMEFSGHGAEEVLEIGGGIGTDLAQFAAHGSRVTDVDLAAGHLQLAKKNFHLRGLRGRFIHADAESLPFPDGSFDLVYSNGVLHHTPNTRTVIAEIRRVLRPRGRAIVMLYAEESLYYWRKMVWLFGVKNGLLDAMSVSEIMSRTVERSANDARPLVKVYTKESAAALFGTFEDVAIVQRQLEPMELPQALRWTLPAVERRFGWNLVVKAQKPR